MRFPYFNEDRKQSIESLEFFFLAPRFLCPFIEKKGKN